MRVIPEATVYLDRIDGSEFERVCQRILQRLDYGEVERTPATSDRGRDLIIKGPKGYLLVECKHSINGSVGRPVVQKLHSAVLSFGAEYGMIMTTGRFAKPAIVEADRLADLGTKIELIDRQGLAHMASRAGIDLVMGDAPLTTWVYEISDSSGLLKQIKKYVNQLFESRPRRPSTLTKILDRKITWIAAYQIRYDLDAFFETSVGMIHDDYIDDASFLLSGDTGEPVGDRISDFFDTLPTVRYSDHPIRENDPDVSSFALNVTRILDLGREDIIERHSEEVSYYGGNNVFYTKLCVPNRRQFTVTDLRQVHFPVSKSRIQLLKTTRTIEYLEHPEAEIDVLQSTLRRCNLCNKKVVLGAKPYLCNHCGSAAHRQILSRLRWKRFKSHGFDCDQCGRTMCRNCARVAGGILRKKVLCQSCVPKSKYPERKISHFLPLEQ